MPCYQFLMTGLWAATLACNQVDKALERDIEILLWKNFPLAFTEERNNSILIRDI